MAVAGGGIIGGAPAAAASGAALAGSAKAQRTAVQKAVEAVLSLLQAIAVRRTKMIRAKIAAAFPTTDIEKALAEEARREVIFRKRSEQRTRDGMKLAMAAKDPSAKAAAIQNVLTRERRFAEQRTRAAGERVLASAERQEMRTLSPQGAVWNLGPRENHCVVCPTLADRFWPWEILDRLPIPLHHGCGCYLSSFGEALKSGQITAEIPTLQQALQLAGPAIQTYEAWQAEAERKYGHLAEESAGRELAIRLALVEQHAASPDLLAAQPLAVDAELAERDLPAEPPAHIQEAEANKDGAMVALYPAESKAEGLALKGGEKPDELHVTLAFLGKAEDLDFEAAKKVVEAWAKKTPRLQGKLSGVGHFDLGKGKKVTYRSVDLPKLPGPREELVKALDKAGVPAKKDHGYSPHMSLDYKVRRPPIKQEGIRFDHVDLSWGEDRHSFKLEGSDPKPV